MPTKISGNRGEWGELYALCKLLSEGVLHNSGEDLQSTTTQNLVLSIIRKESDERDLEYVINRDISNVEIYLNGRLFRTVPQAEFALKAAELHNYLESKKGPSFDIPEFNDFIDMIGVTKLKPSDTDKPDITVKVFDSRTGSEYITRYSIKSFFGANPTLVNSSALTYFYYELVDFSDSDYESVASLPRNKVKQRVALCKKLASEVRYSHLSEYADVFHQNLLRVHPYAEATIGYMILESYAIRGKRSLPILEAVAATNPMNYEDVALYQDAYIDYLWAVFFGMIPSVAWENRDSVDGFLIVEPDGSMLSQLVVRKNTFADHLLSSTNFDTPSTSPGRATADTGCVFERDGKYYLTLSLQIKYGGPKLHACSKNGATYASASLTSESVSKRKSKKGRSDSDSFRDIAIPRFTILD